MADSGAGEPLPDPGETAAYLTELGKPTVAEVLRSARERGRVALQPRCGVGDHPKMGALLQRLEQDGRADILTITIDSHTRLGRFDRALASLRRDPDTLNGYPLVTHGWRRGRELNEQVGPPLQIRHGSPDARTLFQVSVAAGITSFEGGGITYNLPYSKDVPLRDSMSAWREVDARCGELAELGVVVDREMFGTLTAVLMPPSISLAISLIEAVSAAAEGVRCLSISYPQSGNVVQDIAALQAIPVLAARYLPSTVEVHPVLHEFMGVFPRERHHAEQLIFFGALVARLGGAAKLVTKTYQEAFGIPDPAANAAGLRLADIANSSLLDFVTVDTAATAEEREWILREVADIVDPVLGQPRLINAVVTAFADGRLDVPFSASRHARSEIIPGRDPAGAIRYHSWGRLPMSEPVVRRNRLMLRQQSAAAPTDLFDVLQDDINYFPRLFGETAVQNIGHGGPALRP
ncbi:methylaspartate mutase epsilon subunit [Allocatelliglobosispora scoriae]|uniref:Methylaspartate mutase epsilon subunit n=1 Tax=Allocatelliglobosispora scoriae TaxID=643052 RepID=A0A841BJ33_9ACTN|nr:methylaspartate mutase [Allocatelliglobosispora scoriae]MBB5867179.1 methylaspartate mutase epsilon subunit [Allocatelliglobosispora scoriae]